MPKIPDKKSTAIKEPKPPVTESYSFEAEGKKLNVEDEAKKIDSAGFNAFKLAEALVILGQKMYGVDLYDYQKIPAFRIIYSMLVNDGADITMHFARQCIAKGQLIYDRDGTLIPIEEHKDSWKTGDTRNLYSIKGLRGYETRATSNHPFFTERGWVDVKDLKIGDKIQVLKRDTRFGNNHVPYTYEKYINKFVSPEVKDGIRLMTVELSELLGWLTADGSVKKGQSVKFTNINHTYLNRVQFLVEKYFQDIKTKRYAKGNGYDLLFTTGENSRFNTLKDWIQEMSFVEGFPTAVNYLDKENLGAFFRGMYPADGYTHIRKSRNTRNTPEYECGLSCGNSYLFAQYCREFLNKLGIRGRLKEEKMKKNVSGETFKRILFTGNTNAINFRDTIGDILGKKNPPVHRELKDIKRRKIIKQFIGEDGEVMEFVRVISKDYVGKGEVWDITVPNKGWFLSNGIKVHNSGKSEVIAFTAITMGVFFPVLAKVFPKELGHFKGGVKMGIIAPQLDQVETVYSRCLERLWQDSTREFMSDDDIMDAPTSIRNFSLKSGSFLKAQSGAKQSKIESKTYHIVYLDEAQDLDDVKIRKCVAGDSLCTLPDGTDTTVDTVIKNKLTIGGHTGIIKPKEFYDNGVQEVTRITLSNGMYIDATDEHKHKIIRRKRFNNYPYIVKTKEIQLKDRLPVASAMPYFGNVGTYEDGVLAGYMLGDGYMKDSKALFCCFNPTLHRLKELVKPYNCEVVIRNYTESNGLYEVAITGTEKRADGSRTSKKGSNGFINRLKELGIYGETGSNKYVPNKPYSKEFHKGLIEGLVETDGSLDTTAGKGRINFSNTSEKLVRYFQRSCQKFGIHGALSTHTNKGGFGKTTKPLWVFDIKDVDSVISFNKHITLFEKQERLNKVVRCTHNKKSHNKSYRYPETERYYQIVKIEKLGERKTYCIDTGTEDHLWVTNGIITHNSVRPMLASTFGTMVRIGTSTYTMNDFYRRIVSNGLKDKKLRGKKAKRTKMLHFRFDYLEVIADKKKQFDIDGKRFHTLYKKSVEQDKRDMGDNSDEFRLSYKLDWLFSTGMFTSVTDMNEYMYNKKYSVVLEPKNTVFDGTFNVAGLDIAKARASTVLTIGAVDSPVMEFGDRAKKRVLKWVELHGLDYATQLSVIIHELMLFNVKVLFLDYTGVGVALGDLLMYHLSEEINIIPYTFSSKSKSDMWKELDEDKVAHRLIIPAHKDVVDTPEYKAFEEQMLALSKGWHNGYMVCQKTPGFKDDFADSLGLMNLAGNFIYEQEQNMEVDKNPFYAAQKTYEGSSW